MGHETSSTAVKLTSQLSAFVRVYYDDKLYSTGLFEDVIQMYVHGLSFYYYFFSGRGVLSVGSWLAYFQGGLSGFYSMVRLVKVVGPTWRVQVGHYHA